MKTLVIRASEWLRGLVEESKLRNRNGKMCCLGIHAVACGIDEEAITGHHAPCNIMPSEVTEEYEQCWLQDEFQKRKSEKAMYINDDHLWNDEERIEKLRPIFEEVGWKIDWRPDE